MIEKQSVIQKWGEETCESGWVSIPTVLLFAQNELNISSTEMVVLLNLLVHWWTRSSKPFPSQTGIAFRTGLTPKTVQKALHEMEKKKLLAIHKTARSNLVTGGRNLYDLSPLVERLSIIAPAINERLKGR